MFLFVFLRSLVSEEIVFGKDSKYVFKIQPQKEGAFCKGVSLDSTSCGTFQSYLRNFDFQRGR